MPTLLHVVRHGETDWNRDGRIQGHTDVPLNPDGRRQAIALGRALEGLPLAAAYASDLARAWETAELALAGRGLPVVRLAGLREKHFGTWEGLTDDEVRRRFPKAQNGQWGDGETAEQLADRVIAAIDQIAGGHSGEGVLVVTHGGSIRSLYRHAGVEPGRVANCAVVTFVWGEDRLLRLSG